MELANPPQSGDVMNDFDFGSLLQGADLDDPQFDFDAAYFGVEIDETAE